MNERERQLLQDIRDSYCWIAGDNDLEMEYLVSPETLIDGWYAWEYNGNEAFPIQALDKPLITTDEIEKYDVDVYKVFDAAGCYYCG